MKCEKFVFQENKPGKTVYKTTTRGIHKADYDLSVPKGRILTHAIPVEHLMTTHMGILKLSLEFPKP